MKNLALLCTVLLSLFSGLIFAQKTHTVGPKETFYSIGRDYQVHPRELAEYNKMDLAKGLTIGQVIKIPAVKKMKPVETASLTTTPASTPIYHTVKKQENLFQVRMQYNKVPMDSLKKWNNLSSENVKEGTRLIVGYTTSVVNQVDKNTTVTETPKVIEAPAIAEIPVVEKKEEMQPVINASSKKTADSITLKNNEEKLAVFDSLGNPIGSTTLEELQKKKSADSLTINNSAPVPVEDLKLEGFFKSMFNTEKATHQETGIAACFKSTSGWDDGRYYCLHNSAPVGSIVKITNNDNQKSAYAKVLDGIPDLDANKNISVRISKAMAEKLGMTAENAEVSIRY